MVSFTCNYVVAQMEPYEGKYLWQSKEYTHFIRIKYERGYVDEYSD